MSVLRYTAIMPRSTHLSPAARLELLLPWINHEGELRGKKLHSHLVGFLQGFRGSGLRAQRDAGLWEAFRDDPVREIHEARKKILRLLVYGRPASTPPVDYRYPTDPPGDQPPDGWRTGMFAADDSVRDLDQLTPCSRSTVEASSSASVRERAANPRRWSSTPGACGTCCRSWSCTP